MADQFVQIHVHRLIKIFTVSTSIPSTFCFRKHCTYQSKILFPRMRKIISKKEKNLSFTHEIMRDTTRVGESVLTNDNRRVSPGYLLVILHVCAHRIGF